jgi:hypothetical protein
MRTALARTAVMTSLAVMALAGCGEDEASSDASRDDTVVVDITIADGEVTPTGEEVEARVGEPIELHVDSDAADELHVHSQPEHSFEVEADPGNEQVFGFTVDIPGQIDVESHETGGTIVTLVVRP